MKEKLLEFFTAVVKAPLPTPLALGGLGFLALGILDGIPGKYLLSTPFRLVALGIGGLLLVAVFCILWQPRKLKAEESSAGQSWEPLTGFANIFAKASQLIKRAEREIWVINFVSRLGSPHSVNPAVVEEYSRLTEGADFNKDVDDYLRTFRDKIGKVPVVKILTINENTARINFLDLLKSKPGYENLDVSQQHREITQQKREIISLAKATRGGPWPSANHRCQLRDADRLPIQLLITGIASPADDKRKRCGCLVFMVGTGTLWESDAEPPVGIYTEAKRDVVMFKDMAQELMNGAAVRFDGD